MKTILHIGAHRTGTTSFQSYMRQNAVTLREAGLAYWGPFRTRKGLFAGILPGKLSAPLKETAERAHGRIALQRQKAASAGVDVLFVSDENMMGSVRKCLVNASLYPDVGLRIARYAAAFDGKVDQIVVTIRAQDLWWRSAAAYSVTRGMSLPSAAALSAMVDSTRGWRDVLTDVACAAPEGTQITVVPFESFSGQAEGFLSIAAGVDAPTAASPIWLNAAPKARELEAFLKDQGSTRSLDADETGRWQAFDADQRQALREHYADDMYWLRAGADGLVTLTEDPLRQPLGVAAAGMEKRGHAHVERTRYLAQPG